MKIHLVKGHRIFPTKCIGLFLSCVCEFMHIWCWNSTRALGTLGNIFYHCAAPPALRFFFETGFHEAQTDLGFVISGLSFFRTGVRRMHHYAQPEYLIVRSYFRIQMLSQCIVSFVSGLAGTVHSCLAIPWLPNVLRNVRNEDITEKLRKYKNAIGCIRKSI